MCRYLQKRINKMAKIPGVKTNFKISKATKTRLELLKVTKNITITGIVSDFVEEWVEAAEKTSGVVAPIVVVSPGILYASAETLSETLGYFVNKLYSSLRSAPESDKSIRNPTEEPAIKELLLRVAKAISHGGNVVLDRKKREDDRPTTTEVAAAAGAVLDVEADTKGLGRKGGTGKKRPGDPGRARRDR